MSEGKYVINVRLKGILDYENRSLYNITIKITDKSFNPHSISGSITVQVLDVQDEPPIFFNAPYAATVPENMDSVSIFNYGQKGSNFFFCRDELLP